MDCETYFFKRLKQIQSKPRGGGYKDHTKLIQKLIDLKMWNTMAERKLLLEELKLFCTIFDVSESTVRSWNNNLLQDPRWLPNHDRQVSYNLNQHEENVLAEVIRQIIDSELANITNTLVRTVALRYYYSRHEPDPRKQVHFCDE
ncbi:hypothetical protein M9Y10_021225 [Tritrichomonas musculus]|uniref:Uncharacterized protein n=1 Tax=Tritrichomonas musculus TaxID=1915356 RepID=A0ABR2HDE1_9EUKA